MSSPEAPVPEGFWKRHQRHMPRRLPRVLLALGLLLVPAVVVIRIFTAKPVDEAAPAAAPTDAVTLGAKSVSLAGIEMVEAKSVTRAATFDAPAVLALDEARTARIGSLVEGNVVRVLSGVGDRVPRGAVLAEMNSPVVHDAWADYRKAVSERRRRETELAWAKQSAGRAARLHKEKALSLQEQQRAEEAEATLAGSSAELSGDADLEEEIAALRARLKGGVFCSECGFPNGVESRFCSECGSPLQSPRISPAS